LESASKLKSKDDSDIFFYFGMMHQHKGDMDQAIAYFNKVIQHSIHVNQIDLNLKFINACKELRGWE
jgi:hypothetical protein